MHRFILFVIIVALLALTAATVYAAGPPDMPPGLERAIAAQEKHNPQLLVTPGVVGTAVGVTTDGNAAVKIFTEKAGVARLPDSLDGVPVVVEVTGKLIALKPNPSRNTSPTVTITSPANNSQFNSGALIHFAGTAIDKQDGDLSSKLVWQSSRDSYLWTGSNFDRTLSDGTHTITALVTDRSGKTGSASVTINVGPVTQLATTDCWPRPVPVGISTGNVKDVSAGTIACRVRDAQGNVYALSNTHVYAPYAIDNLEAIGDYVMQPGRYDTPGQIYNDSYYLGQLTRYVPIVGSIFATNYVDAAIALTTTGLLDKTTPTSLGGYGIPNSNTVGVTLGMVVQKFGRTTQLTKGKITGINATVMVGYGAGWYAWFDDQIIVESATAFIKAGDSGSLLITDNSNCNPVGLLFAGNSSGKMAIANPIDLVLGALGVTIDGK